MRNPKRIDKIVESFAGAWHLVPDFRFWQFIMLLLEYVPEELENTDPFFWEEDVWSEIISRFIDSAQCKRKDESNDNCG